MKIYSFQEALDIAKVGNNKKPHLLLGNGFSIACRSELFSYDALFETAKSELGKTLETLFKFLKTKDFEFVIRSLVLASQVTKVYRKNCPNDVSCQILKIFDNDTEKVRDLLAKVISQAHPNRPDAISNEEYINCREFLHNFDKMYTLNYDLLLYWALMIDDVDGLDIKCDDGFRSGEDDPEIIGWDMAESHTQTVYYLHGALHLYDTGSTIEKHCFSKTAVPLVDHLKRSLAVQKYPIFVAEGTRLAKETRIIHNAYLHKGLRSLTGITGSLFIYGHSLAENDNHILHLIANGKVARLFISLYGDTSNEANQAIIGKAEALKTLRDNKNSRIRNPRGIKALDLYYYDAASAQVWRDNG